MSVVGMLAAWTGNLWAGNVPKGWRCVVDGVMDSARSRKFPETWSLPHSRVAPCLPADPCSTSPIKLGVCGIDQSNLTDLRSVGLGEGPLHSP